MKKTQQEVKPAKRRIEWYQFITPFLGIKWGAEVTLVGYVWILQPDNLGLRVAAGIAAFFMALEWCQMAWCEFKRRTA